MLYLEGYDTPSIVDPWVAHERVDLPFQTLLTDEVAAQRVALGEMSNWELQNDKGWNVTVF